MPDTKTTPQYVSYIHGVSWDLCCSSCGISRTRALRGPGCPIPWQCWSHPVARQTGNMLNTGPEGRFTKTNKPSMSPEPSTDLHRRPLLRLGVFFGLGSTPSHLGFTCVELIISPKVAHPISPSVSHEHHNIPRLTGCCTRLKPANGHRTGPKSLPKSSRSETLKGPLEIIYVC